MIAQNYDSQTGIFELEILHDTVVYCITIFFVVIIKEK